MKQFFKMWLYFLTCVTIGLVIVLGIVLLGSLLFKTTIGTTIFTGLMITALVAAITTIVEKN